MMKFLGNPIEEILSDDKKFYTSALVRTPKLSHQLAWWSGGIFLLLILATFLPWTQNISSKGRLTSLAPEDRPQAIHATIAGRIEKWYVAEGQKVNKGDTILQLSEINAVYFDPNLLSRTNEQIELKLGALESSKQKAAALNKQLTALTSGLRLNLNKAKNKVSQAVLKVQSDSIELVVSRIDYQIAKDQFERQQKLYDQGLKSLTELEQRKLKFQESSAKVLSMENKLITSKNELDNSRIELFSIEAEYLDKIAKTESELSSTNSYIFNSEAEISKMNNEYANLKIRSGYYYITVPQEGHVVKALKAGIGETIKAGESVVSIMPLNPQLAVELYVKPMDVPLLRVGSKVRLQFDGWPALVFSGWPNVGFGTFGGEVAVIDNIDSDGSYRILVVPDKEEDAWPEPLRVGSGVYGWAMLSDVPIYFEIWRQLNGFPPDYVYHDDSDPEKEKKIKDVIKSQYE